MEGVGRDGGIREMYENAKPCIVREMVRIFAKNG